MIIENSHFLDAASLTQIKELDDASEKVSIPFGAGRTVWRRWGEGPPVVLIHGGGGCWLHWFRNIRALARFHTVWAPDLPCFGDSDVAQAEDIELRLGEENDLVAGSWRGAAPLPIDVYARIIAEAVESIFGRARISLVGFSFGGAVASHVCARLDPQRIGMLVLVGSAALVGEVFGRSMPLRSWHGITDREAFRAAQRANLAALMIADPAAIDDLAVDIQILGATRARTRRAHRRARIHAALAGKGIKVAGIWGRRDATMSGPFDPIRQSLERIDPSSELYIIENAGHWAAYESDSAFNTILTELLQRTG